MKNYVWSRCVKANTEAEYLEVSNFGKTYLWLDYPSKNPTLFSCCHQQASVSRLSQFAWLIMHILDMAPGLIFTGKPLDVAEIRVSVTFWSKCCASTCCYFRILNWIPVFFFFFFCESVSRGWTHHQNPKLWPTLSGSACEASPGCFTCTALTSQSPTVSDYFWDRVGCFLVQ